MANSTLRLKSLLQRLAAPAAFLRQITDPVDDLTRLANRFGTDKGTAFAGRNHYTRVYCELFEPLRLKPVRLLEIGLLHISGRWDDARMRNSGTARGAEAPSLRMWARYFPQGEIFGFDINDFSGVEIPRCRIWRGDMGSREDLTRLLDLTGGEFDVIIDDASHASHHQQIALGALFPSLKPGGLYVIEDLTFQRESMEPEGALKTLDMLRSAEATGTFRSPFMNPAELRYLEDQVARIAMFDALTPGRALSARDSLAVLWKKPGGR